jgi:hypothetical protein
MRQPADNWHGCPAPAPTSERYSTDPQRRAWGADAVATANAPAVGNGGHDFVAADFPGALSAAISDPQVRGLVERWPTGGIDQVRDILWAPRSRIKVRDLAKQ